jgi:hypothetical protein
MSPICEQTERKQTEWKPLADKLDNEARKLPRHMIENIRLGLEPTGLDSYYS